MPKFTIITYTGRGPELNEEPLEFPDQKAATDDAQIALAEMARERLPNGKSAGFEVRVADASGKDVYVATLQFAAKTESDLKRDAEDAAAAAEEVAALLSLGSRG